LCSGSAARVAAHYRDLLRKLARFMHYNFVRIHQTLKISPAMAAGVTDKLWEMTDMVKALEDWEASQAAA
jgi:hypothetical protein